MTALPLTWFEIAFWAAVAVLVLRTLVARARRGGGKRPWSGALRVLRPRARTNAPWNYEAELLRMCHGDERARERLIAAEQKHKPELSRAGAALAAVTRLRHERR